jgi:hypothetical protein
MITISEREYENLEVVANQEMHKVPYGKRFIPMDEAWDWIHGSSLPGPGDEVVFAVREYVLADEPNGVVRYKARIVNYSDDRVLI